MARYFNTSGPNIPEKHYTLERADLIKRGVSRVKDERYFTIWAPRQTGKSTYFRLLANELLKIDYKPVYFSIEGYDDFPFSKVLHELNISLFEQLQLEVNLKTMEDFSSFFRENRKDRFVLVIDEIESLNPEYFGQFLHTIRNLYHTRIQHSLKSVILVGVSNIVGIVQDHTSPFNIADNQPVPYFSKEEVFELLGMHETETGQLFEQKVKEKIADITACQPGLVNGFAYKLVEDNANKKIIDYNDYLQVEDWYLRLAIDKNIANIVNKAKKYRPFIENLLFNQQKIKFDIERESIKVLYTQGVLKDANGYVEFWVPLYKKKLYSAFYPYFNSESDELLKRINLGHFFIENGRINFDKLIAGYKDYVKRRGFRYFRDKDKKTGRWKSIKEAAMIYSFEAYIQTLVQILDGKSYLEPHAGLGDCDLLINIHNVEYVVEAKIYRDQIGFDKGKRQLAHYCNAVSVKEGIYLVFVANDYRVLNLIETSETIDDVLIKTYLVFYDADKDF